MKVKVEQVEQEWNFPCLGIAENGLIVLFSEPKKGTVVVTPNKVYIIGYISDNWEMSLFTPFKGKITIEQ